MKTKLILFITFFSIGIFSCQNETQVVDPIYEFVSFIGNSSVNLNEHDNSVTAFPVVVQLWAFNPYKEDIDLSLEVTGNNAQEGVDFTVTPHDAIKIRKGSLTSDTVWIKTIDNTAGTDLVRTFEVKIKTVSKNDVKIGLGIKEPQNAKVTFTILDDECSKATSIYNANLNNSINHGSGDVIKPASASLNSNSLTLTGDLIDYSPFSGATLTVTLTPESAGATKGSAIFGEQETGTDNDGYAYKFIQTGNGTYDTCSGTISIAYDIYYMDGDWVYWYSVTNIFSAP